jgi:hypothetical protein
MVQPQSHNTSVRLANDLQSWFTKAAHGESGRIRTETPVAFETVMRIRRNNVRTNYRHFKANNAIAFVIDHCFASRGE